MSNLELNCKWHFAQQIGGREDGPNDPMQDNFKKTPYASLIRESIQNSLDVPLDESQPVRMEFSISRIRANEYENFFKLKKHAEGCIKHFTGNDDAKISYQPMIDYFNSLGPYDHLSYIKVSDYNTRGMDYVKGDTNKPFYAFVRAAGVSSKKDSSAGGSFGFGKAAYFYISPLRTIFVSTQTEGGKFFFEGVSSLCTHRLENQEGLFVSAGYYDNNEGEPVTDPNMIPSRFRRNEPGTDIYILGIDATDRSSINNEMIEAVLRNFWMAIYEGKLEVKVNDIEITKDNLQEILKQFFADEHDTASREKNYNPLPYMDAVVNSNKDNRHIYIEDILPIIGRVRFYAVKSKNATDKILFMRKPLMLVKARRTKSSNGFYGIFICDDVNGNEYLRKTENPAHNEWNSANWRENGKIHPKGKAAIDDVDKFIIMAMEQMFAGKKSDIQNIQGLEEFLYIPTAVDEDDDFESESLIGDAIDLKDEEGNSLSTVLTEFGQTPIKDKPSIGTVMIESPNTKLEKDKEGSVLSGHGIQKKKEKGGGGISSRNIDDIYTPSNVGLEGSSLTEIPVVYRSFAQTESGKVIHTIIIHSDYNFENGRIDLEVGGDQSIERVAIKSCSLVGKIYDNTISGLSIVKGKNIMKIQFADNMKHAVKLAVKISPYELK